MFLQTQQIIQKTVFEIPLETLAQLGALYAQATFGNYTPGKQNFITENMLRNVMNNSLVSEDLAEQVWDSYQRQVSRS